MRKLLRVLASMKLAVILIAYLAATGMIATMVPQGQTAEFYHSRYPGIIADVFIATGFTGFFGSILFLLPALAFFLNLSACTFVRLAHELRKQRDRRFGPILMHFGLMVLVIGAILSFATRKDGIVYLAEGEQVELPEGRTLSLLDFTFERYADNRPKDWTSDVRIKKDGKIEVDSFPLRVNKPLRVGALSLYQASYGSEQILRIKDAAGVEHRLSQGEFLEFGGEKALFMAYDQDGGKALFRIDDAAGQKILSAGPGEFAGRFEIIAIESSDTSGIQAVQDFGYPFVLSALVIMGIGVFLTFYRKLGELSL